MRLEFTPSRWSFTFFNKLKSAVEELLCHHRREKARCAARLLQKGNLFFLVNGSIESVLWVCGDNAAQKNTHGQSFRFLGALFLG